MSIASDIRGYADNAVNQGKHVLDSTISSAQGQLNDVTGQAGDLVGKAKDNVGELAAKATEAAGELRASAEKAINFEAIKTAVEPYLAQVKEYTTAVSDRAEALLGGVKNDKRVAQLVDTAGSVTGAVVETVQERIVKPVQSLAGRDSKPATKPAAKASAPRPATKPAATKPATKPAAKPTARKASPRRSTKS